MRLKRALVEVVAALCYELGLTKLVLSCEGSGGEGVLPHGCIINTSKIDTSIRFLNF